MAIRSGKPAYTASTRDSGVVGPIWSGMLQCSCSQRELDLERRTVGGVAVLGNESGYAGRVDGDAAAEQQRGPDRAREQPRRARARDLRGDRLVHRAELDTAQRQ